MRSINVIDAIMGAGKTSWAVQHVGEADASKRFIYITPFLDEIKRIKSAVTSRTFIEPNNANQERRKLRSLKELIAAGADIAATHSLFQTADDELIELLAEAGYTLILDEVMDVIEIANITRQDIEILVESGKVAIEDSRVIWISEEYVEGRFFDIKQLARAGNLFFHRGRFLVWSFPARVFNAFDAVYVMTYLFDAQLQRYYYDLHGIQYEYMTVKRAEDGSYSLAEYNREDEQRADLFALIDVYDGPLNDLGRLPNSFSATWLKAADSASIVAARNNMRNYLRNICKAPANAILWTTKKDKARALASKGFTKSFLQCNARATNEYADRWALAYLFNRYMHPHERAFFEDRGITVNQELLAVSDLLQWIWRSRIRNGHSVRLYLPSSRMRALLLAWSKYEI
ncbi:hypothetical protein [Paenibacillus graminis]|uniref:hypothetical protein n=1 Tax=Paenibacillus graminis TaxID=189425 RepID=UPI002DC02E34|nr:hypothetical protein [Paenibacillus graminis]MEC0167925.1 hypothetical protein [Paenibacillus graminis]